MTKKKKEKTVQNKGQWITYVVYMLRGAACGIFDLMYMDTAGQSERGLFSDIIPLALMLIGIYAAMLIQLIIHEASGARPSGRVTALCCPLPPASCSAPPWRV